jgi:hypothetical protein
MRKKIVAKRAERIPKEDLAAAEEPGGLEQASGEVSTVAGVDAHEDRRTSDQTVDYSRLGEQVASVLEAVEVAVSGIEEEARGKADQLIEEAQQEAAKTLNDANRDAEQMRLEAAGLRAQAEEASRLTRQGADAYAEERKREADAEASRVLDLAEEEAARRRQGKEEWQRALYENIELTESRLKQLVGGLRDLAVRLEDLLQTDGVPVPESERGVPEPEPDATLDESLKASLATQESRHGTS